MTFVHLHVHCEKGSQLDGGSKIEELIQKAKDNGSPALAITDHGSCAAIPDFITLCKKKGIKPIPGVEAYMTRDRTKKGEFLKEKRLDLCEKYSVKEKPMKEFIKRVKKHPEEYEMLAADLLQDQLMNMEVDLFSYGNEPSNNLMQLREDIYDYLSYEHYHLVLIALNQQGLEDLYAISSDAYITGFYSDPRTDLSVIRENNWGRHIIATSACLGSYFALLCLAGRLEEAVSFIEECKQTFHSFYLEKQATHIPAQMKLNQIIDQLAIETNTPKIITTDVHYAHKEDYESHNILVAASMGKCIADENRLVYAHEFWMKTEEEIRAVLNDDEAIANTYRIAEMVNVDLPKKPLFPKYPISGGDSIDDMIRKQSWNALFAYALKKPFDLEAYSKQLDYELSVITSQGFSDYFLIVSDFIQWLKNNGYRVGPGRGSAAGSLVAFLLRITTLDPIEWNLMFERFLNPERIGYPDIDLDVPYAGAKAVQQYLKEKYGHDKVAQIGTFGTLAARAAIRLFGKTLGYSLEDQDKFAKAVPEKPGISLKKAFEDEPMVQRYAEAWPDWWNTCLKFEGYTRSVGVHAGGVVLSPEPLTKVVPLRLDKEGLVTTEYDMGWIEKFLVKFDILKLDTLDLISFALKNAGIPNFDIDSIDLNDPSIYQAVYNQLNLSGIFQCESDLFRGIISEMKPNSVQDISVIVALGRPGPLDLIPSYINRKWGREKVTYPFPSLEPVLKDTYGVYVYQEQVMKSSVILGGFTRGQSDILRKGIAKKKHDLMNKWIDLMIYGSEQYKVMREDVNRLVEQMRAAGQEVPQELADKYDPEYLDVPYIEGAINRGYDEPTLLKLKAQWIKFGEYCFNYAHSACYAVLSVQTAYLKTYYPAEFMAALLTISEGKKDKNGNPKNAHYMQECEGMGIQILPPDLHESRDSWTPVITQNGRAIRYGLSSIPGVTNDTVEEISKIGLGFIQSFEDFLYRVEAYKHVAGRSLLNKTRVIALIQAGAFDNMNPNRNLLHRNYLKYRGEDFEVIPAKTSKKDILQFEKKLFGTTITVKSRWEQVPDGKENVTVTGHVIKFDVLTSKKGSKYCNLYLETPEDEIKVVIFGYLFKEHENQITPGFKIQVKGTKQGQDMIAKKITHVQQITETWDVEMAN